jgi:hypothetical protein
MQRRKKMRTLIDYDVNVYCPELLDGDVSRYDSRYWRMAFRNYRTLEDLDWGIQLPDELITAIGLDKLAQTGGYDGFPQLETWMDGGLDCWIDLDSFITLYAEKIPQTMWVELSKLPKYEEEMERA